MAKRRDYRRENATEAAMERHGRFPVVSFRLPVERYEEIEAGLEAGAKASGQEKESPGQLAKRLVLEFAGAEG